MPPYGVPERLIEAWKRLEIAERRDRISGVEFGERVGKAMRAKAVSPAQVSRWRTGKQAPTLEEVAAIAKVCGVSASWLAFGEGGEVPDAPAAKFEPVTRSVGRRRKSSG